MLGQKIKKSLDQKTCEIKKIDFTKKKFLEYFPWNIIFHGKYSVLNFFPSSKLDFWPFLKLQKMDFGQKQFREN